MSQTEAVDERWLQMHVLELFACFLRWALEIHHQRNDPVRQEQQRLGGQAYGVSPMTPEDRKRKLSLQTVAREQRLGARLANKKLCWNEMTPWQQQLVKSHEEEKNDHNKRREPHKKKKHKLFEA